MKKLVIGLVATVVSIVANAATCNWSSDGIATYGTTELNSGYAAYFFETAIVSQEDAISAIAKGDFSFVSNGYTDGPVEEGEFYGTSTGYINNQKIEGYLLIFDNAVASSAEHYYISDIGSGAIGGAGQAANIYFDASATETTSNWQSIPEPTSGLLLLLGVAGLALRRRRA